MEEKLKYIKYRNSKAITNVFISILLLISLLNLALPINISDSGLIMISGFTNTLNEAKDSVIGLARFVENISKYIGVVTGIIGFRAIILLISLLFFSTAYSFLGIPRGKYSLMLSLITVNSIWFVWEKSFNPDSYAYINTMLKTNLILLTPLVFIIIIIRTAPVLLNKIPFKSIKLLFIKKRTYTRAEFIEVLRKYHEDRSSFEQSLLKDIFNSEEGSIFISGKTNSDLNDLEKTLKKFKVKSM